MFFHKNLPLRPPIVHHSNTVCLGEQRDYWLVLRPTNSTRQTTLLTLKLARAPKNGPQCFLKTHLRICFSPPQWRPVNARTRRDFWGTGRKERNPLAMDPSPRQNDMFAANCNQPGSVTIRVGQLLFQLRSLFIISSFHQSTTTYFIISSINNHLFH